MKTGLKIASIGSNLSFTAADAYYFANGIASLNITQPLLLKKIEFYASISRGPSFLDQLIQRIGLQLNGFYMQKQNPLSRDSGSVLFINNQLTWSSPFQWISEEYTDGILFLPNGLSGDLTVSFSLFGAAPYAIGDNISWQLSLFFEELNEEYKNIQIDSSESEKIDLSQFYPMQ
jgi:hypothetical protein